jgi:hypothetical protein
LNQTDLRSGTKSVDRAALSFPNDNEIQQRTLNRNTWLDLNYVADPAWAVTLSVPYHDRFHTTIAAGDTDISTSRASGLGDVRVLGRYQKFGTATVLACSSASSCPPGASTKTSRPAPRRASCSIAACNWAQGRPICSPEHPGLLVP